MPSANGRVIRIVSIAAGAAELDTDGDGAIDNGASLGVTLAERQRLAELYSAGQSLWRVPINHFSPWDCNWPYGPDCDPATQSCSPDPDPRGDEPEDDPCEENSSIIECQNQTLGERVAITGTPISLNYRSDRVVGRRAAYTLDIALSGATAPSSLQRIDLEVSVAGRIVAQSFSGAPNTSIRRAILGHELGHALGLGHMDGGTASIMTPSVSSSSLTSFDHDAGGLLYTRSPGNTSPDVDSALTYRGSLAPSRAVGAYDWVCGASPPER